MSLLVFWDSNTTSDPVLEYFFITFKPKIKKHSYLDFCTGLKYLGYKPKKKERSLYT